MTNSNGELKLDGLIESVALIFAAPFASVSLVGESGVSVRCGFGAITEGACRTERSLCAQVIRSNEALVINDLAADSRPEDFMSTDESGVRFYAGAPLMAADGTRLGAICVMDVNPREFSERECVILSFLGAAVVSQLEGRVPSLALQGLASRCSLFASALEQIDDAILITDAHLPPDGPKIIYVNAAFSKMTGHGVEEVIGKIPGLLLGMKTECAALDPLHKDLLPTRVLQGETVKYRKDGSIFHVDWTISPVNVTPRRTLRRRQIASPGCWKVQLTQCYYLIRHGRLHT
jgi:PAS domain S-box-containing protein